MKVSPARAAAFDALFRIEIENTFSSVVLPVAESKLSPSDRALCHEITLGVLRRKIYLDRIIDELSNGRKLDIEVRLALQVGLFQMIFLDRVPEHSAINESVELVSRAKKVSAKGFVNALLRSYQRVPVIPVHEDEIDKLSIATSHPRWLVERWIEQFGFEATNELCEANNRSPGLSFRLVGSKSERKETISQISSLDRVRRSEIVGNCFLMPQMDATLTELSQSNRIYFQDEGSQLVAEAVIAEGGAQILDVCAAPGGKTTMIAAGEGRHLVAGDVTASRVSRLRETCLAQGALKVSIVQYDAEVALPFEARSFDTVFVDAPCSGTGTIRHNPEIRYSLDPADLPELSRKQLRILGNASELLRQSGSLIYSTCSVETEENEGVCERFLQSRQNFDLMRPKFPPRFLTSDGFGRTFPHRDDMDGFFVAAFRRR
jgi:16S rRNA (cytosine967-C5)-methyltransferase